MSNPREKPGRIFKMSGGLCRKVRSTDGQFLGVRTSLVALRGVVLQRDSLFSEHKFKYKYQRLDRYKIKIPDLDRCFSEIDFWQEKVENSQIDFLFYM